MLTIKQVESSILWKIYIDFWDGFGLLFYMLFSPSNKKPLDATNKANKIYYAGS